MDFVPLHVYTGYSFLKSGLSLPTYVALAKKQGQSFCALSDYGTMTGFPELTSLCAAYGMQPLYGADIEADGLTFGAYVMNEEGYHSLIVLCRLMNAGTLNLVTLKNNTLGLRFILDMASPVLTEKILEGQSAFAAYLSDTLKGMDVALGIPYLPAKPEYIQAIRDFVAVYPYVTLAYPHVRYAKPEDAIALNIVEAIAQDAKLEEKSALGTQCYLDAQTLQEYYSEAERVETTRFLKGSAFVFAKKRGDLPTYPHDSAEDSVSLLRRAARIGLKRKLPNHGPEYDQRLEYELDVIVKMGYADYFLIVADYVHYAKTHGISVGPGRGSAAGSLVSFALGIVSPDPIKYGLLFERFLNPERQSMPDIDIDFADVRRDEIAVYLQQKYGADRVAHIVTMQSFGAKASIRDIGRVFNFESRHIDMLAKTIPNGSDATLRENYKQNPAFRKLVDSDPYYLEIVSLAAKIEGLPRQPGLHAAGVVLSKEPVEQVVPVVDSPGVGLVAQYEMTYLEAQGVLKMDLLGLRNLTLIDHCIDLVAKHRGVRIDYQTIPYEDREAINLIASGKTMGLFQLESRGMNRAIALVKPTEFTDVVAVISLYRPGPADNIGSFARRKAGMERITYLSPLLEPILKETYGIIVYQEQIMQIVTALAGFTYGQADLFRRAVSKKDAKKLESLKGGFLAGCAKNGVDAGTAQKVYDLIYKFADYGFNKSHALVYGILACQMAYLKVHYPIEFYCAILDGTSSTDPKFAALTYEIKSSGYRFALPDINKASLRFEPSGDRIMFPFTAVKGMQRMLAAKIVEEREINGPYGDIFDFAMRNKKNGLTVALLVKLIDAGCLDSFGYDRARMRLAADSAIRYAENFAGESGQELLLGFEFPKPEIPTVEGNRADDLLAERECLGMMVSGSPLESKAEEIQAQGLHRLNELPNARGELAYAGVVQQCKAVTTKTGKRMAFLTLYDEESIVEVTLFAEVYDASYPILKEGNLVKANIYKSRSGDRYTAAKVEAL